MILAYFLMESRRGITDELVCLLAKLHGVQQGGCGVHQVGQHQSLFDSKEGCACWLIQPAVKRTRITRQLLSCRPLHTDAGSWSEKLFLAFQCSSSLLLWSDVCFGLLAQGPQAPTSVSLLLGLRKLHEFSLKARVRCCMSRMFSRHTHP